MSTRGANAATGRAANRAEDFAVYDRLPPKMKHWLQDAPLNLGSDTYAAKLRRRDPVEAVIDSQEKLVAAFTSGHREGTKALWGANHPMAEEGKEYKYQLTPNTSTITSARTQRENERVQRITKRLTRR